MPTAIALDHETLAVIMCGLLAVSIAGLCLAAYLAPDEEELHGSPPDGAVDAIETPAPAREPNLSVPVAVTREVHEFCPKCEMSVPHQDCIFGPPPKDGE
jgi:hypothetical protein